MTVASEAGTKARLLQAARQVFAEHGLEKATIREICSLARANVAAVNYHFGSKEKLYAAVLKDYLEHENRMHPRDAGVTAQSSKRDRLRAYLRSFLRQTLGDGDPVNERLGRLLTQEFIEPSAMFGEIFEKHCRPSHDLLLRLVREYVPQATPTEVAQAASSVIGQCVLFDFAKEAVGRMNPELTLKEDNIEEMTDFILEFSLGGLSRLAERQTRRSAA